MGFEVSSGRKRSTIRYPIVSIKMIVVIEVILLNNSG